MSSPVLCLDLGTTGVRALLVDAAGVVRGRAYRRLQMGFPAVDRVEQDALEFAHNSRAVLAAALADAGVAPDTVRALGIVTQRSSAIAWDRVTGEPLAPVIGWQDRRTLARVQELQALGLPVNTLASCTKFEWLVQQPSVVQAAQKGRLCLGTPDAWLTWWLSGGRAFVTDVSSAGATGLLDALHGCWLPEALELFGLQADWLPDIVATNALVAAADAERAGHAFPLAARCGDQQSACYAQGVREVGDAKLTLGTSAMLDVCTGADPGTAPRGAYDLPLWHLLTEHGDSTRRFCHEGTVITAGAAVEWLLRLELLPGIEQLDALAGQGHEGVTFVPALAGLGTPHLEDAARGAWLGLSLDTDAATLVRAVLDGVAQRCADVAETLQVSGDLAVDGGLGQSRWLLQRIADLTGKTIRQAAEAETTALGGAALAASSPSVDGEPLPLPAGAAEFSPRLAAADRHAARQHWRARLEAIRTLQVSSKHSQEEQAF